MTKFNEFPNFVNLDEINLDFNLRNFDFEQFRIDLREALKEYVIYYDN